MRLRLNQFRPSVLFAEPRFMIRLTIQSLIFGLLYMLVAYWSGYSPIIDFTFFVVASILYYLVVGAGSLIMRDARQQGSRQQRDQQ